jgi:hypothetical protein
MFRDRLYTKYRSSSKAKLARRKNKIKKIEARGGDNGDEVHQSSSHNKATPASSSTADDSRGGSYYPPRKMSCSPEDDRDAGVSTMPDFDWLSSCSFSPLLLNPFFFPNDGESIPAASTLVSADIFEDISSSLLQSPSRRQKVTLPGRVLWQCS